MKILGLAVVIFGIVAYGYFGIYEQDKKEAKSKDEEARLVQMDKGDVKSFILKSENIERRFTKKEGEWFIESPVQELADQQRVSSIINSLLVMRSESIPFGVGESFSKKEYGLDQSANSFTIESNDGLKFEFQIGNLKSYDGNSYIHDLTNGRLMVFSNQIDSYFKKPLFEYRDKRVVRLDNIDSIEIKMGSDKIIHLISENSNWKLKSQSNRKLNKKEIEKLIRSLYDLRLIDLIDSHSNEAKYGLIKPKLHIILNGDYEIRFGASIEKNKYTYISSTGKSSIGKVYSNVIESFLKPEDDYFDLEYLFKLKRAEIEQIEINEEKSFSIVKSESDWQLKNPRPEENLNTAGVDTLLNQIVNLRPVRLLDATREDFPKTPQIKMSNEKGQILFELTWGNMFRKNLSPKQGKEEYYPVKTNLGSEVVAIPKKDIEPLLKGLFATQSKIPHKEKSKEKVKK